MLDLRKYSENILSAWRSALSEKSFAIKLLITPGLFFLYSAVTQKLGTYVEMRQGVRLEDNWLYLFPAFDFSMPIFLLLYTSLSLLILTHIAKPKLILRIIEMHFAVAVIRQICILLIALEPPVGLIVLRDVFLENTVYPRHSPLTKDLFFSGHVASILIYFLIADGKYLKYYFAIAAVAMSTMILCMRVHYTYDVLGAIMITPLIYFTPVWYRNYLLSKEVVAESID